jgi:fructokinase
MSGGQPRARFTLVGVGEILWDDLSNSSASQDGLPDSKDPRKPNRQAGGAPGNFAYIASALGAEGKVVSRVGNDASGKELLQTLRQRGLNVDAVEIDPTLKTGIVTVEFKIPGQPEYVIHSGVAWDHLAAEPMGRDVVTSADAVCFGTLAQRNERSRTSIRTLLSLSRPNALKIFDVNLRQTYFTPGLIEESLKLANIVKINEPELDQIATMLAMREETERGRLVELAGRFELHTVAFTRGDKGSLLYSDGRWSEHPGICVDVTDTVGAGDAFTAALALGLHANWPLDEINRRATEVAAYVCTQPGGMPELPPQLCAPFFAINR